MMLAMRIDIEDQSNAQRIGICAAYEVEAWGHWDMIWDGRLLGDLVYYANQVVFCDLQGLELHIIKIKKKRLRCSRWTRYPVYSCIFRLHSPENGLGLHILTPTHSLIFLRAFISASKDPRPFTLPFQIHIFPFISKNCNKN